MINLINALITLYSWAVVCGLVYVLYAIAHFYQEKSGQRSYYEWFLAPMGMFALAAVRYTWLTPLITGDIAGELLFFVAGILLIVASHYLLGLMIGKR